MAKARRKAIGTTKTRRARRARSQEQQGYEWGFLRVLAHFVVNPILAGVLIQILATLFALPACHCTLGKFINAISTKSTTNPSPATMPRFVWPSSTPTATIGDQATKKLRERKSNRVNSCGHGNRSWCECRIKKEREPADTHSHVVARRAFARLNRKCLAGSCMNLAYSATNNFG